MSQTQARHYVQIDGPVNNISITFGHLLRNRRETIKEEVKSTTFTIYGVGFNACLKMTIGIVQKKKRDNCYNEKV